MLVLLEMLRDRYLYKSYVLIADMSRSYDLIADMSKSYVLIADMSKSYDFDQYVLIADIY